MDYRFENHGTIVLVQSLNDAAYEHLTANADTESWQWMGRSLAVDHRYAMDLAQHLRDDGFTVGG